MGGWHWKRPGHFSDKAGGGGLLPEEAVPQQLDFPHPKVVQREEHIPVSVMPGMWLPSQGWEEPSWGLEAGGWGRGQTCRTRKTLQALGEKLRKASPSKAGTMCAAQQQVPLQCAGRDEGVGPRPAPQVGGLGGCARDKVGPLGAEWGQSQAGRGQLISSPVPLTRVRPGLLESMG